MTATIWSKFFWADWLSDAGLRRCSPAARGLWMDLLCLAAQGEPFGTLAKNGAPLTPNRIARNVGMSEKEVVRLLAELEGEGVFSRDGRGRIYSRRMLREAKALTQARASGRRGGLASREKQRGIFKPSKAAPEGGLDQTLAPISQKPEAKPQSPEARVQAPAEAPPGGPAASQPLLERVAAALRIPLERLLKKPAWLVFGDTVEGLRAEGCDDERDLWPTIHRIAQRLKEPPASPAYFRDAVLEARDRRLAEATTRATAQEQADRLAVFHAEGIWSSKWGPRPEAVSEARGGQ